MLREILFRLLNFVIPPRPSERLLTRIDTEELLALKVPSVRTHGATLPYHDERVTALVWELKYYANKHAAHLASASLQEELLGIAAEEAIGTPLLIPIPMYPSRRKARGHNQTEILCTAVMKKLRGVYSYAPEVLIRVRNTPQQQGLSKERRLTNVYHSMRVSTPKLVHGRSCVVVDDVTTTGATLHEAKRALIEAGASTVFCVSLAGAMKT